MFFLDYLYYQFTNFYYYFEKDGTHKASGIILTCGMLSWNLIFLMIVFDRFYAKNLIPDNKYAMLLYCLPIILLIGLRYWKFTSYEEIREKVKSFSNTTKIIADILLILYVIISLPVFIYIAAYIGNHK
ncbi:hypothetical protein [Chryseobacterium sp. SIMBA_028]|uniref:hypothetical protein n=1 Tax=Chryseobacterium sp. SIMBA_028 TaxID=3085771 RepID=UPI00397B56E3